jgi:hypothetical protein
MARKVESSDRIESCRNQLATILTKCAVADDRWFEDELPFDVMPDTGLLDASIDSQLEISSFFRPDTEVVTLETSL